MPRNEAIIKLITQLIGDYDTNADGIDVFEWASDAIEQIHDITSGETDIQVINRANNIIQG